MEICHGRNRADFVVVTAMVMTLYSDYKLYLLSLCKLAKTK